MRFESASDEEFDEGDLVDEAGKHGEKRRCRFLVSTLVQGVDNDEGAGLRRPEWPDDEFLHSRTEGLLSDIGLAVKIGPPGSAAGEQAGRREWGRWTEGCSCRRNFLNRRSSPQASHPQSSSPQMFGRWSTFPSWRGR